MKAIYKYEEDFGRMGSLSGIFVADTEDVARLLAEEAEVYLGEVLGKHSEVQGTLTADMLTEVSRTPAHVNMFLSLGLTCGTNPVAAALEQDGEWGRDLTGPKEKADPQEEPACHTCECGDCDQK